MGAARLVALLVRNGKKTEVQLRRNCQVVPGEDSSRAQRAFPPILIDTKQRNALLANIHFPNPNKWK